MNADEITREPLEYFEHSERTFADARKCIWAVAMRLMEAGIDDAPKRIDAIGRKLGISSHEIERTVTNAAKRSGWTPQPASPKPEIADITANPDIRPIGTAKALKHTDKPYMGDCPACLAMMDAYPSQAPLMEIHAEANGKSFDEMWNSLEGSWSVKA